MWKEVANQVLHLHEADPANGCGTNLTITGYTGPTGAVMIPDNIGGLPVTIIGAQPQGPPLDEPTR